MSVVRCQVSGVRCQVSGVRCGMSPVTCHLSLTTTATPMDPLNCKVPNYAQVHLVGVRFHMSGVKCPVFYVMYPVSCFWCHLSGVMCHLFHVRKSNSKSHHCQSHLMPSSQVSVLLDRCHVSHVKCQVSSVSWQMSDVTCQVSDVRCKVSCITCLMS